ncbi:MULTISPECIES: type II secretion system protein GspL [Pseudoalteromonas]|uniref:Type II secretion system protein L n=1 Tax=Pseudoalteromonas amylolytica TaxID=1859457 RepID=A0A1S1MP77_9GAMM|nr:MULTISPECIES: type II secretion system protein GspL [Pseudoalteromonas]OHU86872.1 type II secretion system protein GspL [Pseudoalteromonas amylolytica]OHU89469.1 type II secretion system protein GspL [Pseudoalteromonas sp. JW3]
MTEKLMIRVGQSHNNPIHWLIFSSIDEQIIASGELDSAEQLPQLAEKAVNREVTLLLSASQVQLKNVLLPAKWNRKLEQALPFMLEEQVACDIDELFIAVGQPGLQGEQHSIEVAICNKQWLQDWLALFNEHNIEPARVLPDALLLPEQQEKELSVIELGQQWLCRFGQWHISAIEKTWGADYLYALQPSKIVHYSPADALPEIAPKEAKQAEYDLPLALFAKQLDKVSFNLRQGTFAAKKKQPQWWKDWRSGLLAASIAVGCFVLVKGTQLVMLQKQADDFKAQAVATYQQAFPGKVVRPHLLRNQIKNELDSLSGTEHGGFLELTNHLVAVYREVENFTPETLRYDRRRNELRIRARADGFQVFGQVKAILEQRGLSVQQGSLNNDGDVVIGEIRLRGDA